MLERVVEATMRWNFRVWGFGEAIALRGLLRAADTLGDRAAQAFVYGVMRTWLGRGVARSPEDHVGAGRELLEMHRRYGDDRFLAAARQLAALHAGFPAGPFGAKCHRPDMAGWRNQIWVDCMDVDGPFLARLAVHTGETGHFDAAADALLAYAVTLQEDDGLLTHGYERYAGRNGSRWARGNGWALMGMVDTLACLPRQHAHWEELHRRLLLLLRALRRFQDPGGLWHTVVDDGTTYLESTLAAMAAHALHEGFRHGVIQRAEFDDMAGRARHAVVRLVDAEGVLGLVSEATPVGAHSTYATRPFGCFPWGQGPLLLMLTDGEFPDT